MARKVSQFFIPVILGALLGCGGSSAGYTVDPEQYTPVLYKVAGDGQTAPINTAFPINLKVQIRNAVGQVFPTHYVTFTAPSSGPSGLFQHGSAPPSTGVQVITDGNGYAEAPSFVANGLAGAYDVVVVGSNTSNTVAFHLTNQ